jgi:predicted transposase/invertase (TIGR01784 family)
LIEEEETYVNEYALRNKKGHCFTDLLKVVILELPKLPEKEDEAVWPWLKFFKCKKQEEYEMLAKKHPELKEAVICVKKYSLSEHWQTAMLRNQMSKWKQWGIKEQIRLDLEEARTKALAEGLAEGLSEGRAEGMEKGAAENTLKIARKMKSLGRPLPEIAEITGLPTETIEQL